MMDKLMWVVMFGALAGTLANIYKLRWCFILWGVTNTLWTIYNCWYGHWALAAQFGVYAGLAVWGWCQWGRKGGAK